MKKLPLISLILLLTGFLHAQPIFSSQQEIGDLVLYQDFKDSSLYYYAPGKLNLGQKSNGTPDFQVLQMRYKGTNTHNDQDELRYLNVVQLRVQMERVNAQKLNKVKEQLPKDISIRPLSINSLEAYLVTGVGEESKPLGGPLSIEATNRDGQTNKHHYWTERTFSLILDNTAAQLLNTQLENKQLAWSINYAMYADMLVDEAKEIRVEGDSTLVDSFTGQLDEFLQLDTMPVNRLILSDAFSLEIDLEKHPDLFKQIDINETGIPVGYPAINLQCFDFTNESRPDLLMKIVEVKAMGLNDRWIDAESVTFSSYQSDINGYQVKFSGPVLMDKPVRYRIVEYDKEHQQTDLGWQVKNSWLGNLNVSTPGTEIKVAKRTIEIEIEKNENISRENAHILFEYTYRGKKQYQMIDLQKDSGELLKLSLIYDKESPIYYFFKKENQLRKSKKQLLGSDNYIYLKVES